MTEELVRVERPGEHVARLAGRGKLFAQIRRKGVVSLMTRCQVSQSFDLLTPSPVFGQRGSQRGVLALPSLLGSQRIAGSV